MINHSFQTGKDKEGVPIVKKSFQITFRSIQRFAKPLSKKSHINLLKWDTDVDESSSYRIQYERIDKKKKYKTPIALYFEHSSEAYEFLVKSDITVKTSLIRILDEYQRRKDEERKKLANESLLEKIRSYAQEKKKKNLNFLEEADERITKQMLLTWLTMSKALESQKHKIIIDEKEKNMEDSASANQEEEQIPFEDSKKILEQRMREREEEEIRLHEEEYKKKRNLQLAHSIQKNQAFLDLNRFNLNRFVRDWRGSALVMFQKQKEFEQSAKIRPESKSIFIKILEINQSIFPLPCFKLSLMLPHDNQSQKPSYKPISNKGDKAMRNIDGQGVYHEIPFGMRVSGQVKSLRLLEKKQDTNEPKYIPQILWELKLDSNIISWNLGLSPTSQRTLDPKDILEFCLINEDSRDRENPQQFKAKIKVSDLLKESEPLKTHYLSLNIAEKVNQDKGFLDPLVKFKVFLGDNQPNDDDWNLDLVKDIKKNNFIRDPVYEEIINLPKYTPKNLSFLIEILSNWGVFDIEMKYKRLMGETSDIKEVRRNFEMEEIPEEKNRPIQRNKELLQLVIESLYDFTIEETNKSHARCQGNSFKFQLLEESIRDFLWSQKPAVSEINEMKSSQKKDFDEENSSDEFDYNKPKPIVVKRLMKLRTRNNGKIDQVSILSLEEMCRKGGIPNNKRPFLWSFLANVEEIKIKAVTFYNSSQKINSFDKTRKPMPPIEDQDISLMAFYYKILQLSHNSDVCSLIRQQINDDIALVNEIEEHIKQELQVPLLNILSALAFLIDMLKSSNPHHLDPYKHIFYSIPILKITRKIIAIINSRYLDLENMNLDSFHEGSETYSESPLPKGNYKQNGQYNHPNKKNEYLAFWMLVSMVSHILPGYFIGMPHELNKEIKTPLRESYQDEIGLKRDLLILKFYIKEYEPAIFQLFEDISLPLEFFYGNMLLSAGADMVHNEMLYRLWDVMFLQKEKGEDPHLILISLVILILRISKPRILRDSDTEKKHASKDSKEINDVIKIFETMSRFLPNPDLVIEEVFKIQEHLLSFLRKEYGSFKDLRNALNNKFQNIRHQNKMFSDLIHHKNNFEDLKENVGVFEIFKLLETLKRRHKLFQTSYQEDVELLVPEEFDPDDDPAFKGMKDLSQQLLWFRHFDAKNDPNMIIHLFLHKLTLFTSREELPFKLEITYQDQIKAVLPLEFNTTCYLNHYIQIPYNSKGNHNILIQITLERESSTESKSKYSSQKENKTAETNTQPLIQTLKKAVVKEAIINLDSFMINYLQKGIAKLDFSPSEIEIAEDYNLTTSEIDFSIILATEKTEGKTELPESSFRNNTKLLAQSLPKPIFKVETFDKIKEVNLEKFHEKFLKSLINVLGLDHISNSCFSINPNDWRKNSKITYEEFRQTLIEAKFCEGFPLDYFALYNSIMNSNRDKSFYFSDFLILLIMFSHTTPKQKALLFYDTLMLFDNTRDICNGVSIVTVKSLVSYLYEVFMLSMPHHQIDNIVEFLSDGFVSSVLSAKIDYKDKEKNPMTMNFTNTLIHISNYIHYYYNTKQLFIGDPSKLTVLKEVLENLNDETSEILGSLPNNEMMRLNVKYRIKGMKHKLQILFDKNWEIKRKLVLDPEYKELKIQTPERYKLIETLLLQNENVLPLGNMDSFLSKNNFILLMERLPMMNYFLSFSILENNEVKLPQISCSVRLDNEMICHIDNLSHQDLETNEDFENEQYKNLSYNWNQKRAEILDQRNKSYVAKPTSLSFDSFPFYESFFNTLKLIQSKIMDNFLQQQESFPLGGSFNPTNSFLNSSYMNMSGSHSQNLKGRKAPELSRIFDVDFRKVVLEMYSVNPFVSGVFYCSLFDLAWLISQNLRGHKAGELKLVIKYFSKNQEKNGLIPKKQDIVNYDPFKRFEPKHQCLALFYYSYQSKEWLPCKVVKRFFSERKKQAKSQQCSYYGVVFSTEPNSNFIFY